MIRTLAVVRIGALAAMLSYGCAGRRGHHDAAFAPSAQPASSRPTAARGESNAHASGEGSNGWRRLTDTTASLGFEHAAALDASHVVAVGQGRAYRLASDRWEPIALPAGISARGVEFSHDALWVRGTRGREDHATWSSFRIDAQGVAHQDDSLGPPHATDAGLPPTTRAMEPPPFPIVGGGRTADGAPVIFGASGAVAVWRIERHDVVHTNPADGRRMYFEQPRPAGWQFVQGEASPRHPIEVLPTNPLLIVGAHGELCSVERGSYADHAVAVVAIPRPHSLAVLQLPGGSGVLHVTTVGITRVNAAGVPRSLAVGGAERQFLQYAGTLERVPTQRVFAIPLASGDALVIARTLALAIRGDEVRLIDIAAGHGARAPDSVLTEFGSRGGQWEIVGAAPAANGGFVGVTTSGQVVAGTLETWSAIGSAVLGEDRTGFPVGVFEGSDGRSRVADQRGAIACVQSSGPPGLTACGPRLAIETRRVRALAGGLIVEDQHIHTYVIDASGAREVPNALPDPIAYAGTSDEPYALIGHDIARLHNGQWSMVATVPNDYVPQTLSVAPDGRMLVGCDDGALIVRDGLQR